MIRIAIVDDEKEQVVMLSTCVSVFFQERNLEYRIFPFFPDRCRISGYSDEWH